MDKWNLIDKSKKTNMYIISRIIHIVVSNIIW
jgi:hypothetical protein